jgi:hypothetical protein
MKKQTQILTVFLSVLLLSAVTMVQAQTQGGTSVQQGGTQTINNGPTNCSTNPAVICNPLAASNVTNLLNGIVAIATPVGAIIAVLAFIWVGFKFIQAQGNPEKITEARNALMYVAIGTAILLGAKIITTVITNSLTSAGVVKQGLLPTQ